MAIEPIGYLTLLIGLLCLMAGPTLGTFALMISTSLGAAAAAFLTAIGGSNLPPAHLLLGFLALDLMRRPRLLRRALGSMVPFRAGFWLLLTVGYGAVATALMPRLFAGLTYVYAIAQSDTGVATILQVPLAPSTGNVTQTVYFIGDLVCFLVFYAYANTPGGGLTFARAAIATALFNAGLGLLDLLTYGTDAAELLSWIRNASYRMLTDVEVAGFKRVVGAFSEASSFAYFTLAMFGFTFRAHLMRLYPGLSGAAAACSFVAILVSTSTTGYVGLLAVVTVQYALSLRALIRRSATANEAAFLVYAPGVAVAVALLWYAVPAVRASIDPLLDATLFSKLDSESGVERSTWNREAWVAFWDSRGLGVGIGSVRASSWLVAVPASIGVLGGISYAFFVISVFAGSRRNSLDQRSEVVAGAARLSCFGQIVASSVAGSFIDLGLMFFIMAGAACPRLQWLSRAAPSAGGSGLAPGPAASRL